MYTRSRSPGLLGMITSQSDFELSLAYHASGTLLIGIKSRLFEFFDSVQVRYSFMNSLHWIMP